MAQYASGSIRIPGLSGSDTNFDDMIAKLVKIESRQVNKLLQWKSDWQTRLDAFKQVRGELMNLQTTLSSMNTVDKFYAKKTSSTDDKVATATASANAMNADYRVEIGQLASYGTWTKDTGLYEKTDIISQDGGSFTYSYKGIYRDIKVPANTTVEGLLKLINNDSKNPGVRAQLVQSVDGIAFQLRGMDTGQSNTLVIRETSGISGLDVDLTATKYKEEQNMAMLLKGFEQKTDPINPDGPTKTFIYTVDGKRYAIDVEQGDTIEGLVGKINAKTPDIAGFTETGGKYFFTLKKEDTTYNFDIDKNYVPIDDESGPLTTILREEYGSDSANINDSENDLIIKLGITPENSGTAGATMDRSITVPPGTTLRGLCNALQTAFGATAEVKLVAGSEANKFKLEITPKEKVHRVTVENGTLEELSYSPPTDATWDIKEAQNAQVRINDYPQSPGWLEVASNTIGMGEVIPGMSFTLLKANSEANISVTNDTGKMMENIQSFVDAVNSFRTLLKSLTSYDEEKEVVDLDYAESQFEMQKGGVLMGNYGMQLIESRLKSCIASSSSGFTPVIRGEDNSILSGDFFSSLSQIGITTNTNEGETNYGLLEINLTPDLKGSKSLEDALEEDPEGVAKLFAVKDEGVSHSDDFDYDSHLTSITKAATYNVSYKVDSNGAVFDAFINNKPCNYNSTDGTFTCMEGDAKGLTIKVNSTETLQNYSGTVSIKQGKVNDLLAMLEGSEGMLGTNGTLRNLEKNYQGIMDGIESKIKKEDDRLTRFERSMTLKFARLEETLSRYNGIMSTLDSQLAQINTSK